MARRAITKDEWEVEMPDNSVRGERIKIVAKGTSGSPRAALALVSKNQPNAIVVATMMSLAPDMLMSLREAVTADYIPRDTALYRTVVSIFDSVQDAVEEQTMNK